MPHRQFQEPCASCLESDGRIILKESQWIRCLCLGVYVCMCVFSGRQVSLDLVLRWMCNCVCVCVHMHKWVVLCSVATHGKL